MPRPRKKQDGKITTVYLERWALEKIMEISAETGLSLGDLIEIWLTKEERIARMVAEYEGLKKRVLELEKLNMILEDKLFKTEQQNEKLRLVKQVLEEENRQLKQENAELRKQLKMSARERKAYDLKAEIYDIIQRFGKDGQIKLLDLLKKLGYSGNYDQHAKEFLEQWFRDERYKLVSDELGLVVKKVHGFGRLAWVVMPADSLSFWRTRRGEGRCLSLAIWRSCWRCWRARTRKSAGWRRNCLTPLRKSCSSFGSRGDCEWGSVAVLRW